MAKGKHLRKKSKPKKFLIVLRVILIISIAIVIIKLAYNYKNKKQNENLKKIVVSSQKQDSGRMEKVEKLKEENSDIVGWLEIEDSNISYPVLQCEDNEFYMTHNYKKEYSKDGSIFLDKGYDWNKPSTNLLIYGHNNIGSNEMFSELINYKDESYYNKHKKIRFTTEKEDAEYQIIAVFLSRVYYKSEKDVFRYYYFIDAENEKEFYEYVQNSQKASLYDTHQTVKYGDQLLTLSTCEYSQKDGRLAVVAKKIEK